MKTILTVCALFIILSIVKGQPKDYYTIKGVALFADGVPFPGLNIRLVETNVINATDDGGKFEFNVKNLDPLEELHIQVLTEHFVLSQNPDSFICKIDKQQRRKPVILKLYNKPALFLGPEVPENMTEIYNTEFTIFLFSKTNDKINLEDFNDLKKRIGLSHQIDYYHHSNFKGDDIYRYTMGRFNKFEDAQKVADYIKNKNIPYLDNPIVVNILSSKPPEVFYRVQIRSAMNKRLTELERDNLVSKLNRNMIEVVDGNIKNNKKYDYFVDLKFSDREEAVKLRNEAVKKGIKDAYVVRFETEINKIVNPPFATKINKNKKLIKRS